MSLKSSFLVSGIWALERRLQGKSSVIGSFASGRPRQRLEVALRHGTWRKLFNFLRIELQLKLGRTKVSGYAYEWEIDTTNICQLKCPLCHTGLDTINRHKQVSPTGWLTWATRRCEQPYPESTEGHRWTA